MSKLANRGRKFSAKKARAFLEAYEKLVNSAKAREVAGITVEDYERWLREVPEFSKAVDSAFHRIIDAVEETALRKALAGDRRLSRFILAAMRSERYAPSERRSAVTINMQNQMPSIEIASRIAALIELAARRKSGQRYMPGYTDDRHMSKEAASLVSRHEHLGTLERPAIYVDTAQ